MVYIASAYLAIAWNQILNRFIILACVLVFVELKGVVTDSEVLILSNKIKELMEVKTDTIHFI